MPAAFDLDSPAAAFSAFAAGHGVLGAALSLARPSCAAAFVGCFDECVASPRVDVSHSLGTPSQQLHSRPAMLSQKRQLVHETQFPPTVEERAKAAWWVVGKQNDHRCSGAP